MPKNIARRFISYEWFKYVLVAGCKQYQDLSLSLVLSCNKMMYNGRCSCAEFWLCSQVGNYNLFDHTLPAACRAVLQVVVILFALGTIAAGQFHRFRISICCLLAVTAVLFCDASQTFYYRKDLMQHFYLAKYL